MIRDVTRAACIVAVMAAAASLLIETRARLAAIDAVHRQMAQPQAAYGWTPPPPQEPAPGPLARFGQAAVGLADAAFGVVR